MNVYHPKITAWVWLLGIVIIAALGSQALRSDWLETGFLALLPTSEQKPEVANAIKQHNEAMARKVIWLSGAGNAKAAIANARVLKRQLQDSGLFKRLDLEFSAQSYRDNYQQLFPYRYQLLDAQTKQALAKPQDLLSQNLAMLYSPLGQMQAAGLERDPLFVFSRYFNAQNSVKLAMEEGIVILRDGATFWALLLADLEDGSNKLDKLETLQALVDSAQKQAQTAGRELMVSGMALFTAAGSQSANREMSTVGLGSSIGILLLMLLTFRSPRPLLLSFLAIGCGMFSALVLSVLFFGKIHIITLVFGASLIGVADDYAVHFFCDSFGSKDWNPRQGLRYILPGLFIGLLTNLLSYAGLGFSPFPGLQEVAFFSAIGLLFAWLTVVMLFPVLLTGFKPEHEPKILKLTAYWQYHWPLWVFKWQPWLIAGMAVFIVGGIAQLTPRDDVRLLQSAPVDLVKTADKIKQLLPLSQDNQFFLVTGNGQNDWHDHEQQLLAQLASLKQQNALKYYQGISDYWPTEHSQQENYRLLKQIFYSSGLLQEYMAGLGFSKAAIGAELKQFVAAENLSLSLTSWLKSADETRQHLWLGCKDGHCLSRVSLTGIHDLPAIAQLQTLPGVSLVDPAQDISVLFERYRLRASYLLVGAYIVVFMGLGLRFGWRNGLAIISVPVLAALSALAMMGWFNQLFSLFNLFALLLVLGIGIDDAVFFFMAGNKRASTSLAVTLSALTTLLAFGLLAISSTQIVHAFGFTISVGILTALLCAPLIGFRGYKNYYDNQSNQ
ncbi:MAG: MMPL family transporter [Methylococcales bacterium]|nr:MMPL family transporter [Methylococcales bacterium]